MPKLSKNVPTKSEMRRLRRLIRRGQILAIRTTARIIVCVLLSGTLTAQTITNDGPPSALISNTPSQFNNPTIPQPTGSMNQPARRPMVIRSDGGGLWIDWYDLWQYWICSRLAFCRIEAQ